MTVGVDVVQFGQIVPEGAHLLSQQERLRDVFEFRGRHDAGFVLAHCRAEDREVLFATVVHNGLKLTWGYLGQEAKTRLLLGLGEVCFRLQNGDEVRYYNFNVIAGNVQVDDATDGLAAILEQLLKCSIEHARELLRHHVDYTETLTEAKAISLN